MRTTLYIFLFLLISKIAICQDNQNLYSGKIDKYPIFMEIVVYSDTDCSIRYYYQNQKKDISLDGKLNGKNIKAKNPDRFDATPTEILDLKKAANGYTGTWSDGVKKLAVTVQKVSVTNYQNPYKNLPEIMKMKTEDPYNYIKSSGFVFSKNAAFENGNAKMEWQIEKYSGIKIPRLLNGYAASAMKKINDRLLVKHIQHSLNFLECSSGPDGEYDLEVDTIFAKADILSINIFTSYYCGGAHPDFGASALNFDTKSGMLLNFDDMFWFGKSKPPAEGSDEWITYRSEVFAKEVVKIFKKLYPHEMNSDKDEEGCDYTDPDVWDYTNWFFTKKGLYLGPVFARAYRACDAPDWSIIPYNLLKQYLSPGMKIKLPN